MRALILAVVAAIIAACVAAVPADNICLKWKPWSYDQNTPANELFIASTTAWVIGGVGTCDECMQRGDVIDCWSDNGRTFGHHDYLAWQITNDYCRFNTGDGSVTYSNNFYLPFKGPRFETMRFILSQKGARLPANIIGDGDKVMVQSVENAPGCCAGRGFTGWAENNNGIAGDAYFSIQQFAVKTSNYKIAVCKALPKTTTPAPTTMPPTPAPTAAPTPAPTLPNNKPYIRFAHAVPTAHKVTATVSQGSASHTWTCKSFGYFSAWVEVFEFGSGTVTITDCSTGATLLSQQTLLTNGPLVVSIKGYWPLNQFSIETVAASYVPTPLGLSSTRVFNFMPDTPALGMKIDGKTEANGIKIFAGSKWAPVSDDEDHTYEVFDDVTGKSLGSDQFQSPASPLAATVWVLGMSNATAGSPFAPRLIPLVDAPEV